MDFQLLITRLFVRFLRLLGMRVSYIRVLSKVSFFNINRNRLLWFWRYEVFRYKDKPVLEYALNEHGALVENTIMIPHGVPLISLF